MRWTVRYGILLLVLLPLSALAAGAAGQEPVTVSPGSATGAAVGDICPTFSWGAVEGARFYELVVVHVGEEGEEARPVLRERFTGSVSSWTPSLDRCLAEGGRYAWTLRAFGKEVTSDWSPPRLFRVAAAPGAIELEEALAVVRQHLERQGEAQPQPVAEAEGGSEPKPPSEASESSPGQRVVGTTLVTVEGGVMATSFTGDGSTLTSLDPANLSAGTAAIDISGTAATAIAANTADAAKTAATASALATDGANCLPGRYPLGVDAAGNAQGCATPPGATSQGGRIDLEVFSAAPVPFAGTFSPIFSSPPVLQLTPLWPLGGATADLTSLTATGFSGALLTGGPALAVDAPPATVGRHTSLAVVNGRPAISYQDATNRDLMYVRSTDTEGGTWGTPVVVDAPDGTSPGVGGWTSLAVVNGKPAISYVDIDNGELKYVQATDADGASWNAPVGVDAPAGTRFNAIQDTSLVVVNGKPAISYLDQVNRILYYVQATDANGTTWGSPVTVDSSNLISAYPSLAVVNGRPAISYHDRPNGDLKYVRATDVDGFSWSAPVAADAPAGTSPAVGTYSSLAVVNGRPAISYQDATNWDLKYVRATDADGTAWGVPVAVDAPPGTSGELGEFTSMAVVDGKPAIAYHDWTNRDLKYVQATDADGTAWGVPIAVDAPTGTTPDVGSYLSLAVVDGEPAISYHDRTNGDLKFTRRWASAILWSAIEP